MQNTPEVDKKRKSLFFIICNAIIIGAFIILSIFNYMEENFFEIKTNMAVIVVMIAGIIATKASDAHMIIFRASHLLVSLLFFYCVYEGSGNGTVLYWATIMPILFFFFFGKREGLVWVSIFFMGILIIMLTPSIFNSHPYDSITISRFFIYLLIVLIISYGIESSRYAFSRLLDEKNQILVREKENLERALKEIKTLSGLIPICCSCKKVRDDEGFWQQVETYVRDRSRADFTHSICPDCFEKLYPDYKYPAPLEDSKENPLSETI